MESAIKLQDPQFKFLRRPGGFAECMTESELAVIDEVLKELEEKNMQMYEYKPDEFVKLISGPFAGTVGQIESIQNNKAYLRIFFLNKQVRMELPLQHLPFMVIKQ